MLVQNFIKIGTRVWISISPPHTNRQTNICTPIFIFLLAEVPGAGWVNLQPTEHLKNVSLSLKGFKPPQAQGEGGRGKTCTKTFLGQVGMFHRDRCRGLDFHWPSTYQQTNKQTSVCSFIYIYFHEMCMMNSLLSLQCLYVTVMVGSHARVVKNSLMAKTCRKWPLFSIFPKNVFPNFKIKTIAFGCQLLLFKIKLKQICFNTTLQWLKVDVKERRLKNRKSN